MKTFKYPFKTILVVPDEGRITYDRESVKDHLLEMSIVNFFFGRAWVRSFFLTVMILIPLFGIIYGIMKVGFNTSFATGPGLVAGKVFILAILLTFVVLWISLSIPGVIKDAKQDLVNDSLGKGNWKIIDENKWARFEHMLKVSEQQIADDSDDA